MLKYILSLSFLFLIACNSPRQTVMPDDYQVQPIEEKRGSVAHTVDSAGYEKTLSYPYLTIRFKQHDTEMEMILDPLETNLQLDLKRTPDSSLEISSGSTDSAGTTLSNIEKPDTSTQATTDQILADLTNAQSYFYNGDYENALSEVKKSIQRKPTASAYALGGSIYYVNGEKEKAVRAWETALKLNPDMDEIKQILAKVK